MSRRLSAAEHKRKGTFRPHRHDRADAPVFDPAIGLVGADRQRALQGLPEIARVTMQTLLLHFRARISVADVPALRRYARACHALQLLEWDHAPEAVLERARDRKARLWGRVALG